MGVDACPSAAPYEWFRRELSQRTRRACAQHWYNQVRTANLMNIARREFLLMAGATLFAGVAPERILLRGDDKMKMFGLIGKMAAVPGQRDALIAILIEGLSDMPGCLSYVVAKDPAEENTVWITEAWDSEASHKAALSLPSVQKAIALGRPLIAEFGKSTVTEPVGGHGLVPAKVG